MDWFKKHADTITILGTFALCFWTMNEKMNTRFNANALEKDITIIKTCLIIKNIMPAELAGKNPKEGQ